MTEISKVRVAELPETPNVRDDVGDLHELAESLFLRQWQPILIHESSPGDLSIIDGFRRVAAARLKGIDTLDAIKVAEKLSPDDYVIVQLSIAIHRKDLTPYEQVKAVESLPVTMTNAEIAQRLGVARPVITTLRCGDRLIPEVDEHFREARITKTDRYDLSKHPKEEQLSLLAELLNGATRADLARRRKPRDPNAVRIAKIKYPLPSGPTVTVSGEGVSLDEAIEAVKKAEKAMIAARDKGYNAKTAQMMWADLASA